MIIREITFEVLKIAVKQVDVVEIRKEGGRFRRQLAELVLTLVHIFWVGFYSNLLEHS